VVSLTDVQFPRDESVLAEWLKLPHVSKWWGDPVQCLSRVRETSKDNHKLIVVNGEPVGYIRWQYVVSEELNKIGIQGIPNNTLDIDMFIGKLSGIGKGTGPTALNLLITYFRSLTSVSKASICTSVDNSSAIRAFEKSGFKKHQQFESPTFGCCWVLIIELHQ